MKTQRWFPVLIAIVLVGLMVGCASPDPLLVKGVSGYTDVILPEYEAYIKADPKLSDTTKKIRLDSAAGLRRLLEASTPPAK